MRSLVRVCVLVLVGLVAVLGLALPAQAGEPEPAARYVLGGAADGAMCDFAVGGDRYDVVLAVPRESLGRDVRCAEVGSEIHVGPYDPQPGPHSSSTTVVWEVCVWIWTPSGGFFKWCFKITITTSTTVPNTDGGIDVEVLRAEHGSSPVKFCWDEELRNGEIATHCVEITIDAGSSTG